MKENIYLLCLPKAIAEGEPITKEKFSGDFSKIQAYYDEHWKGEFPELLFGR